MDVKKKRLLIIGLFGLVATGTILVVTDPALSPFVASPGPGSLTSAPPQAIRSTNNPGSPAIPANANINGKNPVLPQGAKVAGQVIRDIFAPPAEFARMLPKETPTGATVPVMPAVGPEVFAAAEAAPVLTGIIIGDSTRVAILRQGTTSRSYRVGESAGAYRVSAIGPRSVTIAGPYGTRVLTMGQ